MQSRLRDVAARESAPDEQLGAGTATAAVALLKDRVVQRRGCSYLASIKHERIASSLGEFSFIHLYERDRTHVSAVS